MAKFEKSHLTSVSFEWGPYTDFLQPMSNGKLSRSKAIYFCFEMARLSAKSERPLSTCRFFCGNFLLTTLPI
jgi:hypothetical protein